MVLLMKVGSLRVPSYFTDFSLVSIIMMARKKINVAHIKNIAFVCYFSFPLVQFVPE